MTGAVIKAWKPSSPSGYYWITLTQANIPKLKVYCEMQKAGGGWMLAAKMKDPQSGWGEASSSGGQNSNIQSYSPGWGHFDSEWWTKTTGASVITDEVVADDNAADYKSELFNYYATSGGTDKVVYTNGLFPSDANKRQGIKRDVSSYGSLREMFRDVGRNDGTRSDSDGSVGEYWRITASGGSDDFDVGGINNHYGNWVPGQCRICSGSCSDPCKYGGTVMVGAGFNWYHSGGHNVGGGPAANYGLHGGYSQGKALFLWIK